MPASRRFAATVKRSGINPYVEVPRAVAQSVGRRVLVRVRGPRARAASRLPVKRLIRIRRLTPQGLFRASIMPVAGRRHRLYLNEWMRRDSGVRLGDRAAITLWPDAASRTLATPKPLRDAFARRPAAKEAWRALPPSRRREILSYLNYLKSPAAARRTVARLLRELEG